MTRVVRVVFDNRDVAATLAAAHVSAGTWLHAVLAPPLAQVRAVDLPRMTASDARSAIARNPGRYFPDAREPQVVAVLRNSKGWLAAAAPAAVVQSVHHAALSAMLRVALIEPAHTCWARCGGTGVFSVESAEQTTLIEARRGTLVSVRRMASGSPPPAGFVGAASLNAVQPGGENGLPPAAFTMDFATETVMGARNATVRRAVVSGLAAAAALIVFAAGATLWGEKRELTALQARRAELHARVQQALIQRDTLLSDSEQIGAIASLERGAERWSAVVSRVAEALPRDASLTAFRAEADSVSLEGEAGNAAGVFAAMRTAAGVSSVYAAAPVRQEGGGASGQPVVERFALGARLRLPGGAP
jgi:hypothetical protein